MSPLNDADADTEVDVIFLDIDGVLLPFGGGNDDHSKSSSSSRFPKETLDALSFILEKVPTAVLVLSSTWRVRSDFCNDILQQFQGYGRRHGGPLGTSRRYEQFYDTTSVTNHTERQWEIFEWLLCTRTTCAWVALDDEELLEGGGNNAKHRSHFVGHVVKTDSAVGLTRKDAEQAVELFREQLRTKRRIGVDQEP